MYKGEFQGSEVAVKQLKMPLQQQDRNYFAAEVGLKTSYYFSDKNYYFELSKIV